MALTTLAKLKQYAQIVSFEDDTLLLRMIDAASDAIETYCSRTFLSATYNEVRDGTGQRKLTMRHFPITAVSSVTVNGQAISARQAPMGTGFTFDEYSVRLSGSMFDTGLDNVAVTYTAGLAEVPSSIDLACCEMVALRYKARDRLGVSSKSLAGESISFTTDDFPTEVKRVLDQFKMWGMS